MCGRFTLTYRERERLADELGVNVEEINDDRLHARATTSRPPTRTGSSGCATRTATVLPAKWGLVNTWAKDAKRAAAQINARAETLATLVGLPRRLREAPLRRACRRLLRVDRRRRRRASPIWFHRPDGSLILFAGLYESWQPPAGAVAAHLHDHHDDAQRASSRRSTTACPSSSTTTPSTRWLDPREEDLEALQPLLAPAPGRPARRRSPSRSASTPSATTTRPASPAETNIPSPLTLLGARRKATP